MQSRMNRYYHDNDKENSRVKRNSEVYSKIYGDILNEEKLPVSSNANEIDVGYLKRITKEEQKIVAKALSKEEEQDIIREDKTYDINELLEMARKDYNNTDTKEVVLIKPSYLSQMDSNNYQEKEEDSDNFSLDILADLKPSNNTIVTDPIVENEPDSVNYTQKELEKEFYSSSLSFANTDFDVEEEPKKKSNVLKIVIILLLICLLVLLGYFVINYFKIDLQHLF